MIEVKRLKVTDIDDEMEYYKIVHSGNGYTWPATVVTYDPKQETVTHVNNANMTFARAEQYIKWHLQGVV